LEIADNGVGIMGDIDIEKSESIGMKLIRIFSQKLNSLIEISSQNGTSVKLSIPMG
jgi:two-component sensor histidine kinase